ncbi:MAG: Protein translocase membrane subunit SecG [uncultured Sphingomonadaceae bacterium]|uniref:Protein-export membrane protein SecG n=1 Tax=uncultured Sphingomonadaceae bacterium TaxID=169976 RepID=A0A6J4TIP1_9SPHN|nr:MAG: Protein translocase membrane subunit SecG [uncultured Sphingomonadaceae bacterium]
MLFNILLGLQILVSAGLVTVILMQRSEGGGLGVGGSSSGLMTARGAADFLTRATAILGGAFIILSIALAALATVSRAPASIDTRLARDPATATAPSTAPYDPATQGARPADPLAEVANQAAPVSNSAVPLAQ